MKRKIFYFVFLLLSVVLCYSIFLCNNITFVVASKINCLDYVGIIDGELSRQFSNVNYHQNVNFIEKQDTHGDGMISFLLTCEPNANVYYFNAADKNGTINTEKIIDGLNWMVENSVTKVNISLSSKIKDSRLQDWIIMHQDIINIYSSYNNRLNTLDYPASYDGVIASGSNSEILYKNIDIRYKNNKILVYNKNGFNIYTGNSYLSILSMLRN